MQLIAKTMPLILGLGVALSAFLLPIVPMTVTRSYSAICPAGTVGLCSIGDGAVSFGALGSVGYRLFGVGGAVLQGHFQLVQNGCHTTAFAHETVEELICTR